MAKKHHTLINKQKSIPKHSKRNVRSNLQDLFDRIEPGMPWILALLYFICMTYCAFRYHRIGYFGVETDFYAELVPQAKKILSGHFSPLNYGSKGPVYSFLLAGAYVIVREYFYAGLILNLVSGFVFLVALYHLVKNVFNRLTAVIATCAVMFNYTFLNYTYQAGSDLPFMALCALSMWFLFSRMRTHTIILSSVFGLTAFLTRYNGAFIAAGSVLFLAVTVGSVRDRLKRIGIWISLFIVLGLPWFIPNYLATGNPVHNDNYVNVMLEFYGSGDGVSYESWTEALPKQFTGIGDIIGYDPVYFIKHLGANGISHFLSDMKNLIGIRLGVFVILGFFMLFFLKPNTKKLVYVAFGIVYFGILTLVFYNERFSMYLLTIYIPLAVWPWTEKRIIARLKTFSWIPLAVITVVIATCAVSSARNVLSEIKNQPAILKELKDLGVSLGRIEPDKTHKLIARKPHTAHYAGLNASMFPEDARNVDDLVAFCRKQGIRYVLYSGVEYSYRPYLRILLQPGFKHPDLEKIIANKAGIIFRVNGV